MLEDISAYTDIFTPILYKAKRKAIKFMAKWEESHISACLTAFIQPAIRAAWLLGQTLQSELQCKANLPCVKHRSVGILGMQVRDGRHSAQKGTVQAHTGISLGKVWLLVL